MSVNVDEEVDFCPICDRPFKTCPHTEEERKKREEDLAWEAHLASLAASEEDA